MPDPPPSYIYRDQLLALSQGIALWNPNPPRRIFSNVSIGDVGYLQGTFIRMFNTSMSFFHGTIRRTEHLVIQGFYKSLANYPSNNNYTVLGIPVEVGVVLYA